LVFLGAFDDFKVFNQVDRENGELYYVSARCNIASTSDTTLGSELLNLLEVKFLFGLVQIN